MKYLVTGGTGLVGSSIKECVKDDCDNEYLFLSSKDVNLINTEEVDVVFKNFHPDVVIHLASKVAGLYGNMNDNYGFLVDNLKLNTNILDNCKKYKVKKLINILSTCVFPDKNVTYPLTSDQILNGEPHTSNEGYSYSKRLLFTGSKLLFNQREFVGMSDLSIVNIIPTNLYGEYDNYHLINSHVIPGLIHKCYLAQNNNTDFVVKGSGSAKRQFLYSGDLAKVIVQFAKSDKFNGQFLSLIASTPVSSEISIKQLVDKIVNIFEFKGNVIYDTSFSDGQAAKTTDSNEVYKYFSDFEFTDIDNGLQKMIFHFKENFEKVRK
jgi:GDP-L-fucose synthase